MAAEHAGTEHTGAHHALPSPRGRALVDELLRQKTVQPIRTPDDPKGHNLFETVEELHEFLAYTYAARRAELKSERPEISSQ